jgi:hypothetical protein
MTSDPTIAQVVGERLHRLRVHAGQTQLEAARHLQSYGLAWTRDHVASLETGRRESVGVDELVILASAYQTKISDWFPSSGRVILGQDFTIERSVLRAALSGGRPPVRPRTFDFSDVPDLEADQRVADRLGVDLEVVTRAARALWGHSLTEERNRRLATKGKDPKAIRTLRSGMTKRLMREVDTYLKEGD